MKIKFNINIEGLMKKSIIILMFVIPFCVFSNVAQPGFWNAGGTGNFTLLYQEDNIDYKKIQMVREKISIQLYRGFAVVKAEYWMYNETKDTIKIVVGYPINSTFDRDFSYYKTEIKFDSLYGLEVYLNEYQIDYYQENIKYLNNQIENWYVWENKFLPFDTTKIDIYFIVNTNNTMIIEGYGKANTNGFIYLFETGATWKQPIVSGEIRIQLKDSIFINEIRGLAPDSVFKVDRNKKILYYEFENLFPTPKNNILISYIKNIEDFDFDSILSDKNDLYKSIDEFSNIEIDKKNLEIINFKNPFNIQSFNGLNVLIISLIIICGTFFLLIVSIIISIIIIFKKKKKRKNIQ